MLNRFAILASDIVINCVKYISRFGTTINSGSHGFYTFASNVQELGADWGSWLLLAHMMHVWALEHCVCCFIFRCKWARAHHTPWCTCLKYSSIAKRWLDCSCNSTVKLWVPSCWDFQAWKQRVHETHRACQPQHPSLQPFCLFWFRLLDTTDAVRIWTLRKWMGTMMWKKQHLLSIP